MEDKLSFCISLFEVASGLKEPDKKYCNGSYQWIEYNPEGGEQYIVSHEADNVYDLIKSFGNKFGEMVDDDFDDYDFSENPKIEKLIKSISDRNLRFAATYLLWDFPFDFVYGNEFKDDFYFSEIPKYLPNVNFEFGWSAVPPGQDTAFTVLSRQQ